MRTPLIAVGMTTLLLALAAGAALAQPGDAAQDAQARRDRMQALHDARNASLASFHENRTAAIAEYRAANEATRASFLENKTAVIDGCRAARNASAEDNNSAFAKCVSDGLKPLIQKARAEHQAHREAFIEKTTAARKAAMESFAQARRDANARYGPGA